MGTQSSEFLYEPALRKLIGDEFKVSGSEAQFLCPIHDDTRPSFYLNLETGLCICFACNWRGSIRSLWKAVLGDEFPDEEEPTMSDHVKAVRNRVVRIKSKDELPTVMEESDFQFFSDPTEALCASRSISVDTARVLELKQHNDAWIIPVRDMYRDVLMGVQIKDGKRVLNAPTGIRKSLSLFGVQAPRISEETLIVESPLDVGVCFEAGVNAVATYGSMVSEGQMNVIAQLSMPVFAFDNDEAGAKASTSLIKFMNREFPYLPYRVVAWQDGVKDPGDIPDSIQQLVETSYSPKMKWLRAKIR